MSYNEPIHLHTGHYNNLSTTQSVAHAHILFCKSYSLLSHKKALNNTLSTAVVSKSKKFYVCSSQRFANYLWLEHWSPHSNRQHSSNHCQEYRRAWPGTVNGQQFGKHESWGNQMLSHKPQHNSLSVLHVYTHSFFGTLWQRDKGKGKKRYKKKETKINSR